MLRFSENNIQVHLVQTIIFIILIRAFNEMVIELASVGCKLKIVTLPISVYLIAYPSTESNIVQHQRAMLLYIIERPCSVT